MRYCLFFALLFTINGFVYSQNTASSRPKTYSIKPKVEPPILSILEGSLLFIDANKNGAIDAQESCSVEFSLNNTGFGDALNLIALIEIQGSTTGIQIEKKQALPKVSIGGNTQYRIPILSDLNTLDGVLKIKIQIQEPNGFDPPPFAFSIETRAFKAPLLRITDFAISGEGKLESLKPFTLQLMLQNTGQGKAENISTQLTLPENVMNIGTDNNQNITSMEAGEIKKLQYTLIINARYTADTLPIRMKLQEKHNRYTQNWNQTFELHKQMAAPRALVVQAQASEKISFETASFKSDVDRDIPVTSKRNYNRYALVIGNEDYASRNGNINKAINVDYAQQDALVYAQYLESAFGVPSANIRILTNATMGEMMGGISWLENNTRAYGSESELYFYYSGHGLPDESNRTPFLIPVDISGEKPELGISLPILYESLTKNPSKKITVVLDACFSGGARNQELLAKKGIRVQPKSGSIPGNMVVLSSSSGNQSSAVYQEKQHGFLTYFLLKGIQTKGVGINYGSLFELVQREVDIEASKKGMQQQPQILTGIELGESWKNWTIE